MLGLVEQLLANVLGKLWKRATLRADSNKDGEVLARSDNLRVFGLIDVDGLNLVTLWSEVIENYADAKLMILLRFGSICRWCEWVCFLRHRLELARGVIRSQGVRKC